MQLRQHIHVHADVRMGGGGDNDRGSSHAIGPYRIALVVDWLVNIRRMAATAA